MATRVANVESIGSYFESLPDPRHARDRKHLLIDIVVIAVCGLVCGCDGPTAIHRRATNRRDWLGGFLTLPNGIPSRDCIRRLLCLVAWAFWWLNLWGAESFERLRWAIMAHPWRLAKDVTYLFDWIATMLRKLLTASAHSWASCVSLRVGRRCSTT